MIKRIKQFCRDIKWKVMRANGKLPPCDWWDYKYNLADYIRQGLTNLLYNGNTDWDSPYHKQEKKDLEYVLRWAVEFPWYASSILAKDEDDRKKLKEKFPEQKYIVVTKEELEQFMKRTEKAMKLLGKNIWTLWD